MKPLRVMHVILNMGPGGAERVVLNYLKHMDRSRFVPRLCVLGVAFEAELEEIKKLGVRFRVFNKPRGWDGKTVLGLASFLRKERIEILHLHNFSAQLYGTLAALISDRPKIFRTEHNVVNNFNGALQWMKLKLKYLMGEFHEKIIVVSEEVKKSHTQYDRRFREKYIRFVTG